MLRISSLAALAALLACGSGVELTPRQPRSFVTTSIPKDWTCATVTWGMGNRSFGNTSFVVTPALGTNSYTDAATGQTFTLSTPIPAMPWTQAMLDFQWTSSGDVRAILLSAQDPANPADTIKEIWSYIPPAEGQPGGYIDFQYPAGTKLPITAIDFCYDFTPPPPEYDLLISKTAASAYDGKYLWQIDKTADVSSLLLSTGQVKDVRYTVKVETGGITYSHYVVSGKITIKNPAPVAATITAVDDAFATPVCGVTFPFELAAGATLECTWFRELPDAADGINTVDVSTSGAVRGGSASVGYGFAGATVNLIDRCVDVVDSLQGALGRICADIVPASFTYTRQVGGYEACGEFTADNTATATTIDTGATLTDGVTIPVTVPCETGCTLTPGYWKTHSAKGPAPYDDTWKQIGEDTAFFQSGYTWYSQFGVPPAGNPYWQLSHAYAAAVLNTLNGASHGSIDATIFAALNLLTTKTPAQAPASRQTFVQLAAALDAWNNGLTGPGHCSE